MTYSKQVSFINDAFRQDKIYIWILTMTMLCIKLGIVAFLYKLDDSDLTWIEDQNDHLRFKYMHDIFQKGIFH